MDSEARFELVEDRLDHYRDRIENLEELFEAHFDAKQEKELLGLTKATHRWEVIIGILVLIETVFGVLMYFHGTEIGRAHV